MSSACNDKHKLGRALDLEEKATQGCSIAMHYEVGSIRHIGENSTAIMFKKGERLSSMTLL